MISSIWKVGIFLGAFVFSPVSAYISFQFPESMEDVPNVPFIDVEEYPVIPFVWDPTSKILEYCVESQDDVSVDLSIIQDAMDNINAQLYSGNISSTALYFTLNTQKKCKRDDMKIKLVKSRNSVKAPGYCTRKFINGTIYRPMVLYNGCDITLNVCALQTYASLYNVLMHELLHVVGLDHPDPPVEGSVISYGVNVNDSSLMHIIQDKQYVTLQPFDIMNVRFIALRDFPKSILPDPRLIASYAPKQNASGHIGGEEYVIRDIMSVEECWISNVVKTVGPSPFPSQNPSAIAQTPTKSPITKKQRRKRRKRRRQRRKNRNNIDENETQNTNKGNATIATIANPEIYLDTKNTSVLNISTEIQPDITVDLLNGDVNMKTIVSPKIDIQGQARNYNIITEINPIISIKQRQSLVLPPPKQWDRYP